MTSSSFQLKPHLGTLYGVSARSAPATFDVVLSFDIGNGIRVEKGGEIFSKWPQLQQDPNLPKSPRAAIENPDAYFPLCANLAAAEP